VVIGEEGQKAQSNSTTQCSGGDVGDVCGLLVGTRYLEDDF
jgi:hypothetical protein